MNAGQAKGKGDLNPIEPFSARLDQVSGLVQHSKTQPVMPKLLCILWGMAFDTVHGHCL